MSLALSLACDCCGQELESDHTKPGRMSVEGLLCDAKRYNWRRLSHGWFCDRCIARAKLLKSQRKETTP